MAPARRSDTAHMAMIGAAATAKDSEVRETAEELGMLIAKRLRVADVELR